MNKVLVTVILLIVCVGLLIALIVANRQADRQQQSAASTILDFSNQLSSAHDQINGLGQVNLVLSNNLASSQQASTALSNQLTDTQVAVAKADQEITNLDDRVADLEAQNKALDEHAAELTNTIAQMDAQITTTETKLAESQTNNSFLEIELKKQVAERTVLEQKFNDLSKVREQVHKLRDEALVETRLRWMHAGTDPSQQMKGSQLLMQRASPTNNTAAANASNNSLNVEVESGGAIRIIPPSATGTNPPSQ